MTEQFCYMFTSTNILMHCALKKFKNYVTSSSKELNLSEDPPNLRAHSLVMMMVAIVLPCNVITVLSFIVFMTHQLKFNESLM